MTNLLDARRYLTNFDSAFTSNILTDVLVIGSGVAGARAAIEAARYGLVTVVTKDTFDHSATSRAQGGIAAAVSVGDSPRGHFDDTLRVGCGLNTPEAVELLVSQAPRCLEELQRWGFEVDRQDGELSLGREGGHGQNRIVHAHGDQTGRELARILEARVRQADNIRVFEHCFVTDCLTWEGKCVGMVAYHERHGHQLIWAKRTILASGGCGRIWRESTNPSVATGDGLAAAFRAGVRLRDMEMMQFHPTTLYVAGAARSLISEAVRGEGAYLVDRSGDRFMPRYHGDAELAPRDVVSRAINVHLHATRSNCVYLDVRHIKNFHERFPYITKLCHDFQIDIRRDLIPVRPSAHYLVGGVEVSLEGNTSVEGLLCCGEAASTGVHGANRLASNSLLEGLVFGQRAGETAGQYCASSAEPLRVRRVASETPPSLRTPLDLHDVNNSLGSVMWRNAGIVRTGERLLETRDILAFWAHYTLDKTFDQIGGWETQNKLTVANLVVLSALERTESIGVHYREDSSCEGVPELYHVVLSKTDTQTRTVRTPLAEK